MKWLLLVFATLVLFLILAGMGVRGAGAVVLRECPPDCVTPVVVEPGPTWTARQGDQGAVLEAIATQLALPTATVAPTATSTPVPTATVSPTPEPTTVAATATAEAQGVEREALRDMAVYSVSRQLQQVAILLAVLVFVGIVGAVSLWLK